MEDKIGVILGIYFGKRIACINKFTFFPQITPPPFEYPLIIYDESLCPYAFDPEHGIKGPEMKKTTCSF